MIWEDLQQQIYDHYSEEDDSVYEMETGIRYSGMDLTVTGWRIEHDRLILEVAS